MATVCPACGAGLSPEPSGALEPVDPAEIVERAASLMRAGLVTREQELTLLRAIDPALVLKSAASLMRLRRTDTHGGKPPQPVCCIRCRQEFASRRAWRFHDCPAKDRRGRPRRPNDASTAT